NRLKHILSIDFQQVALPEEKVEELVAEFHYVESKAAEAQESLEKESLEKIEAEVRLELSERLQGDALDLAVSIEMEQFKKEWSTELDDLEIRSAVLLEGAKTSFGSSNWASVYLANTPQEAAALGLQFPGVDEVEEIAEVDGAVDDIKCVDEIELSEEQRRKYRK
uniref:Uncharacterized protein n=1 Tax=Aegilops tauschii subsp. strangulata TaxID=200361 RepID=A0A452YCA4_AEGTS